MPRVVIIHNQPVLPAGDAEAVAERGVTDTVTAVRRYLVEAGWNVTNCSIGRDLQRSLDEITAQAAEVVFNLFEGFGDQPQSEYRVARTLTTAGHELTGSPARALRRAGWKHLAKAALVAAGLPTPRAMLMHSVQPMAGLTWPVIVKPALEHGSIGIDQDSVATNPRQLVERVKYLFRRKRGPVLVEEFVAGREFSIAVIETPRLVTLPIMEFEFLDRHGWPLMTYAAKWQSDSAEYQATPLRHDVRLPGGLAGELRELACRAFRVLGCRDYARIDIRLDDQGRPWIIDVNPNPDLSPSGCLAGTLQAAQIDYGQFVVSLARRGLSRSVNRAATDSWPRRLSMR